ncbi:MAG: heavy metal-responsive transcriptional regulator [Candidatus Lambdaproteobacteria bacterium]|nr:heavy metal-responsive transcriptional regulator [Candidatus Lambdaproteobacteria bacterium]
MSGLTIGKAAAQTGMSIDTIRFYERMGLLPAPVRRPSGYREFDAGAVTRLRFIKRAKNLGFSLREVIDLLSLRVDEERTCADVYALTQAKIGDIERRIGELKRMKQALTRLASACAGEGPTGECPILDALEQDAGPDDV